jgi:ATP-dependent RNA helicase RhlE
MNFESLNIIEPILKSLKEEGYTQPTPIQEKAIPIVLSGTDLIGCAQTGTGKTAAFAVPILQLLSRNKSFERKRKIRSLVVTPTRELAIQF